MGFLVHQLSRDLLLKPLQICSRSENKLGSSPVSTADGAQVQQGQAQCKMLYWMDLNSAPSAIVVLPNKNVWSWSSHCQCIYGPGVLCDTE